MILSALLTSVGINLGLCLLFFTLYSILRKQPSNAKVYAPRSVAAKEKDAPTESNAFNFERLLPTAGWVTRAWHPSEDQLLSVTSLDAVVFMRIFVFSLKVFGFGAVIGVVVLLPINFFGSQLAADFSDFGNKSLDSFSISNVDDGSNWLWVHFCAAYIFTAIVCYLLYNEYSYISARRIAHFYSSKPQPNQFTILVRGIPVPSGSGCSDTVDKFFSEYYSSTYLSHTVVRRTSKLERLTRDADKVYRTLARLESEKEPQKRFERDGIFGSKVDGLDHYGKKLDDLEDSVRIEQSSLAGKEVRAAFVSFKSRLAAAVALHIQQGTNPTEWVTESAPEPRDVHWPFFSSSFIKRWVSKLVVVIAYVAVTILFLIPVAIVQGLANLEQLETWFPFLTSILNLTIVSQVITGYLPSLILQWSLSFVPPIMIVLSSVEGYISFSQIQKGGCKKMLWFTIWNIFFANVLSGTALYRVNILLEPKKIPGLLADAVPAQASFFIAYVVTSGWTSVSSELFRMIPLIFSIIKRLFSGKDSDEFEVPSISYHSEIPRILFFGVLGVTYFLLAPLILPFLLVYCCMGYLIYRNQLLNVYAPKYETGGTFWPIVHNSTIFSLVLMHIIGIGIFGIKKLALASSFMIPLPILTLLFNGFCRNRFLPIFKSYPVECLAKKDKEDQSDSSMGAFYDKLCSAYEDPAMMPIRRRRSTDGHNSPLLPAEV
ncbi:CSC1-like protein HYP1 [Argentina anserina]|uniref:CSC1-like protein HYP1 n=1 Tax=Argentina anserina TaxID=57926 RepID=UPI0021763740|nr:CSC1-like protein HYP1 [Potentilla anserina]XP_050379818.1 CSC1-like protein HYP1 [Potentilla anserina]XP_050379819.1 CSC1-like protein HYP1 [Potentilla anserina]XP_050379820.1 CSC1-like protein HYP1 [Potentilla anserina]